MKAEFHIGNSSGTSISIKNTADELIEDMLSRGCLLSVPEIQMLREWSKGANYGERLYLRRTTITNGSDQMTEYTSL